MNDTVVIDGVVDLISTIDGELSLDQECAGEVGAFMAIRDGAYPAYEGPTEITPTQETQTLHTEQRSVLSNIIINPIPSNYGLITWNGSTLTVS